VLRVVEASADVVETVTLDYHVPVVLHWNHARNGRKIYWRCDGGPGSFCEVGVDARTQLIREFSLTLVGPALSPETAEPLDEVPVAPGVPRLDLSDWPRGPASADDPFDVSEAEHRYYVSEQGEMRVFLLAAGIRTTFSAKPVQRVLTFGRTRFLVGPGEMLIGIEVAELSTDELQELQETLHRGSVAM
jgi:hypothetical protein